MSRARRVAALAGLTLLACAASPGVLLAEDPAFKACARAFGKWVEARDSRLRRLEARPTLLGLDNTWCTTSRSAVAELRTMLAGVRHACVNLAGDEQMRSDQLIARATQQVDSVQMCAGALDVDTAPSAPKARARDAAASKPLTVKAEARASVPAEARGKPEARTAKAADDAPPGKPEARKTVTAAGATVPAPARPAEGVPPSVRVSAPDDDQCLVVTRTSPASYLIENRNCQAQAVLTAIELGRPGEPVRCFTKKVATQIAIAGEDGSEPYINYQCREGSAGCADDVLRSMFPECQPG